MAVHVITTEADWRAGTVPPQAVVTESGMRLGLFQPCPPFSEWSLDGGAYLESDGTLVFPNNNATAVSPLIPVHGAANWVWSSEYYSDQPSPVHPTANPDGTACIKYLTVNYFDSNRLPVANSAGYLSNGYATSWGTPGAWSARGQHGTSAGHWTSVAGPTVAYMRLTINHGTLYPPPSFKVRRPMLHLFEQGQSMVTDPYRYYEPVATILTRPMDLGPSHPSQKLSILDATVPVGASVSRRCRTSVDELSWTPWTAIGQDNLLPWTPERYYQEELTLRSADTTRTPIVVGLTIRDRFAIGGVGVSILEGSLSIDSALGERSTCSFAVRDPGGQSHYFKGQRVELWDRDDLAFAGVIDSAGERQPGSGSLLLHGIRCADWHYLADKRVAARGWERKPAGAIVRSLLTDYLAAEGVTIGEVQDGPLILEAVANYRPISEVMDTLAEKAGMIWWIDPNRCLYFVERATYEAPWVATGAEMRHDSVTVESANPKYRNRQYVKGGRDITDPQTEERVGDGAARTFPVGYPIALVPTVEVKRGTGPWMVQTVGVKGADQGRQWYWTKGDALVTQDESQPVLAPESDRLRITYQGEFDVVVLTEDTAAIIDRQQTEGGGSGLVEDVADEPHTSNREAAFQSANAKLKQYAVIGRRLKFRTRRPGLRPGQLLTADLPKHELQGAQMLIESVSIADEGPILWYDVTAVEGPEQGSWSQLFLHMATRGQTFVERVNIGEQQVLVLTHSVSEPWPWAESVTQQVYACPIPSVALYPSATIYPC